MFLICKTMSQARGSHLPSSCKARLSGAPTHIPLRRLQSNSAFGNKNFLQQNALGFLSESKPFLHKMVKHLWKHLHMRALMLRVA